MTYQDKNIAELARDTAVCISQLAANEVRLAAAELQDSIEGSATRFRRMVVAAAFFVPGVSVALVALAIMIGNLGVPNWAAFLGVGIVSGAIGYFIMKSGRSTLKADLFFPKKTFENLRRDARAVKGALS